MEYTLVYRDLVSLRNSTAEVLAVAVSELYPNIELKGAKVDQFGFSYTFTFPGFTSSFLDAIELKMKEVIKRKGQIKLKTMVYASAKGYLEHVGLKRKIEPEGEHTFIEIGSFIDLASPYQIKNTEQIQHFLLTSFEERKNNIIEIFGNSFQNKKTYRKFKKNSLDKSGKSRFLIEEIILNEKGVTSRDQLILSWKKELKSQGFSFIQNLNPSNKTFNKELLPALTSEICIETDETVKKPFGLFNAEMKIRSFETIANDDSLISYLQSLEKWLKLLELDRFSLFLLTSKKKSLDFLKNKLDNLGLTYQSKQAMGLEKLCLYVEDELNRPWKLFELTKDDSWNGSILSFERVLGFLEKKDQDFWKRVLAQIVEHE